MHNFAQILNGTIINIIIANIDDFFDPNYIWVDLTNTNPLPLIGWSYDGFIFSPKGLPLDIYNNTVTMITNNNLDIYTNSLGFSANVPTGTNRIPAYISLAIQVNLSLLPELSEIFVQSRYPDSVRLNLLGLFLNAQINNFTNRLAYIYPLLVWQNSIIAYIAQYCANVKAQTSENAVYALNPNFNQFIATDPLITPLGAIQIPN